jgi:hypothetical protein
VGRQHQHGPTVSTNIKTWNIKNIELNHANIYIQCGKYTLMVNVQLLRQTNILQSTR